jgi:hypothetical protein
MDSCGFKVMYGAGEISCDCMELVLSSFHYSNKKYDRGCKTFQPCVILHTKNIVYFVVQQPSLGLGLLIVEVARLHTVKTRSHPIVLF